MARAGTSSLAPWRDESWEIWGIPWITYPRLDRAFDIHTEQCSQSKSVPPYYRKHEWIAGFEERCPDIPVYCDESKAYRFKNPVLYPFDEIIASLPQPYLENSISYMIALALMEGVDEIGLWGVHMIGRIEIEFERPSVAYMIGLAQGKGVKVTIPDGCPLFMSKYIDGRYGVNTGPEFERRLFVPGDIPDYSKSTQKIGRE